MMIVTIYSHFFSVQLKTQYYAAVTKAIYNSLSVSDSSSGEMKVANYARFDPFSRTYRFPLALLGEFYENCKRTNGKPIPIELIKYNNPKVGYDISFVLKDHIKLYDYQERARDFCLDANVSVLPVRVLCLQPGAGKGITSLSILSRKGKRVLIVVRPNYAQKWEDEIIQVTDVGKSSILQVSGCKGIVDLLVTGKKELDKNGIKFVIISLRTYDLFLSEYEERTHSGIAVDDPTILCERIGAGVFLVDEAHQEFASLYRVMMYTNVQFCLALSATLYSTMDLSKTHRDQYQGISDVQDSLFPRQTRFLEKTMAKHTHVMSFGWNIHDIRNSRVVWNNRGKTMFSQTALEKSIRKNRRVLKNYLELIYRILEMTYIKEYVDGDTAIIYAHTIKMCQQIRDYVAERLPHLDVRTAIGGDPYENRHEGTIVVTTEGSLGTGTDKKNLRTVVYTVNRSSPVAVDQTAGRLRDLRNRDTKFAYMFCTQIPKTVQYHKEKAQVLLQRAKSIRHFTVNESL